jgi:hypothetical protein
VAPPIEIRTKTVLSVPIRFAHEPPPDSGRGRRGPACALGTIGDWSAPTAGDSNRRSGLAITQFAGRVMADTIVAKKRALTLKLQSPLPNSIRFRMLQRTVPAGFIAPCLPTKTDRLLANRHGRIEPVVSPSTVARVEGLVGRRHLPGPTNAVEAVKPKGLHQVNRLIA